MQIAILLSQAAEAEDEAAVAAAATADTTDLNLIA